MHNKLQRRAMLGLGLTAILACAQGHAQPASYPSKPVSIVVGYPPGGSVDAAGRAIAENLAPRIGGNIVVENVGGASGSIGVQRVVNAPADGYTLAFGANSEFVATKLLNPAQRYDASTDLVPVGYVGSLPFVLVTSRETGITSLAQFLEAVRANPDKYSYGTSGVGSLLHLAGEQIKMLANVSITHIPYRGAGAIANDLIGGSIAFAFLGPGAAKSYIDSGRMVAIGVTSPQRVPLLPDVPALGEHPDLKGYSMVSWYGLMAPKGIPSDTLARLQSGLKGVLADPAVRTRLDRVGVMPGDGSEDLSALMARDTQAFKTLVQFARITP